MSINSLPGSNPPNEETPTLINTTFPNDYEENALYDILHHKNELIQNLQQTIKALSKTIAHFNNDINNTNHKLNIIQSNISTNRDINYIMSKQKILSDKNNMLIRHNQIIHENLLKSNCSINNLKKLYFGLNDLYIENFNKTSQEVINNDIIETQMQLLESRISHLTNMFKCQVCFSKTIDVILMPCNHIYICNECIDQIVDVTSNDQPVNCPVCNNRVIEFQSIYLPI